jgi:two-component system phosphate regulon sensor histidine kinase PhoR
VRKGIFGRIFLLYAVVLVIALAFVEVYIARTIRADYIDRLKDSLLGEINLISPGISFERAGIDDLCRSLKERTGARVTIIAEDGRVLGDSNTASASMGNHSDRPEIQQAAFAGSGSSVRFSDTLKYDFLYIAKHVVRGDNAAGFVRLAVPLEKIDNAVSGLRMKMMLVIGVVLLLTWLVTVWQTDHLRRLLGQVRSFSRALAKGEIDRRLFLHGGGEFDEIAGNLNTMSVKLQEMITSSEEEKNRLNVILRSMPDALLIIDAKGVVRLSSASAREFFGEGAALSGRPFIDIIRTAEFADLMEEVRGGLAPRTAEFMVDHPRERYLSARVSPLFYSGHELSGFVAVFHDITEREKLEQVRKDFVANVSHEIKTPVTAIKGYADTLLEGAINDRENAEKFLHIIEANSDRINSLVDDLMMISKIELGVIRVEKSGTDVKAVVESVLATLRGKAEGKSLYLKTYIKAGIEKISADRNRLIQILTNLVDNAVKFTEKGGVTFGVDEEGGRTFLFVEDTGIGIPAKHLPRMGERFYRVDPARSRKMGGTGLGLAIVKHLVRAHGWEMRIESTEGKGTRVIILTTDSGTAK